MFTDEECKKIYAFLAQTMNDLGLGAVVAEVEQEIEDLESVSSKDIDDLYPHNTVPLGRSKRKWQPQKQAPLPGLDAVSPNVGDLDPFLQREHIYTPRRRALLLINALEFAVVDPVEIGEALIKSLKQEKLLFGDEAQDEDAFVLSAADIKKHMRDIQALRTQLGKLRQGLKKEGTDGYE